MKKKYEVLGVVGEGAYGIVYKCKNKETGKYVAIKKFKETEDELVQKTMKRELKMLQQLKHENIVEFQESFTYKGNLYLVFEYCEKNLLEVLEESPEGLSPKLIKSFIYQMCKAISYMHKNNMIHRDIKPENLLIDDKLNLKLCDFGFSRKVKLNKNNNNINEMTDYVATRWYRSPELLLSGGIYGPDVDYWAVGCIMGELADGNPMFPGENETDQINCIIKVLGNLPDVLVNMFYKNPLYDGKKLLHVSKPETLERRYMSKLGPTAIDFMKGLLQLDPKKRLNSDTVFKHKYFSCFLKDEQKEKEKDKINNNISVNKIFDKKEIINNNISNIEKNNENNQSKNEKNANDISENNKNNIDAQNKQSNEAKVINNTTNINIININNINNSTNNFIHIHNNSLDNNFKTLENKNSVNKIKSVNNINNINNIAAYNSVTRKANNNNQKQKIHKLELKYNLKNKMKLDYLNNTNYPMNVNKSVNMNNNGNKESNSINKYTKVHGSQKIPIIKNIQNLITVSLSQGKGNAININKSPSKIKDISTTFYSYKNSKNNNSLNINKITSFKSDNNLNKKNKYMSMLSNSPFNGYKTFFNKNKSNDKYNYDINTNYFKEELKKYNSNPGKIYSNNVIDEKEEYTNSSNNSSINNKNIFNNNINNKYFKKKDKKEGKLINKYNNNNFLAKFNLNDTLNKKKINGYGTLYNFKYDKKKNNVELPQLLKAYNKISLMKHNYH